MPKTRPVLSAIRRLTNSRTLTRHLGHCSKLMRIKSVLIMIFPGRSPTKAAGGVGRSSEVVEKRPLMIIPTQTVGYWIVNRRSISLRGLRIIRSSGLTLKSQKCKIFIILTQIGISLCLLTISEGMLNSQVSRILSWPTYKSIPRKSSCGIQGRTTIY
jgi:hypothetical protein